MPESELYPRRPLAPASARPQFVAPEGGINLRRCSTFAYAQSLRSLTGACDSSTKSDDYALVPRTLDKLRRNGYPVSDLVSAWMLEGDSEWL